MELRERLGELAVGTLETGEIGPIGQLAYLLGTWPVFERIEE
jgi:hypothetical protein